MTGIEFGLGFAAASARGSEANDVFLELVRDGLTREELAKNIARRPQLWRRFENWLKVLPSKVTQ